MTSVAISVPKAAGAPRLASLKRNRRWALITSYIFLVIFAIFFLMPPYYMVVTALKSDAEVAHMATNPWIIANGITLDQFKILFTQTDFLIFFKNTAIVTVAVVIITMVVSVLAAFSLGRMRFWGSSIGAKPPLDVRYDPTDLWIPAVVELTCSRCATPAEQRL